MRERILMATMTAASLNVARVSFYLIEMKANNLAWAAVRPRRHWGYGKLQVLQRS